MNPRKFSEAMSEISDKYVDEAIQYKRDNKKRGWSIWAAACLVLVLAAAVFVANRTPDQIKLSDKSSNVTVRYADAPATKYKLWVENLLVYRTEEELFTDDTAIFKGKILKLSNIEISFRGHKEYRAIAKIKVEKVYRGPCYAGDTVSVLLPCQIGDDVWVEDTEIVSAMQKGMTGIFMPVIYDDDSVIKQGGAVLALKDIADFGFECGVRCAFLETDKGLLFARGDYTGASGARTLDEIEEYILDMLDRLSQ